MYIKKKDRELFDKLDSQLNIPDRWIEFINNQKLKHYLIIKTKNKYKCTYCQFEFEGIFKVNEMCVCPNCKNKYLVKTNKITFYEFKEHLCILDKFNDLWIVRRFELLTIYKNGIYSSDLCEYGRHIHDKYLNSLYEIFNQHISCCINGKFINHYKNYDNYKWNINNSFYHSLSEISILYPYNLNDALKDTKWKYCCLQLFAENYDDYIHPMYILRNMNNSFEVLVKLKLYSLALDSIDMPMKDMDKLRPFIKLHLKFIQEYDLNYNEIRILFNIKEENIEIVKKYATYIQSDILDMIDLKYADKLTDLNSNNSHEYYDYLKMAKKAKLDLKNKRILYPSNIIQAHDDVLKQVEVVRNKKYNNSIKRRYKELEDNLYYDNKYIIYPVKTIDELVQESLEQNNCVRTYAERICKKECDIYFMRLLSDKDKSLVTVEVRNNKVVQQRIKNNQDTTKEQKHFLKQWEKEVLQYN